MELVRKYLPIAVVSLVVVLAYEYYKKQKADKLAAASEPAA